MSTGPQHVHIILQDSVIEPDVLTPELFAGRYIERVEVAVDATEENDAAAVRVTPLRTGWLNSARQERVGC